MLCGVCRRGTRLTRAAKLLEKTRWLRGKIWYKQKVMAREVLLDADVVRALHIPP